MEEERRGHSASTHRIGFCLLVAFARFLQCLFKDQNLGGSQCQKLGGSQWHGSQVKRSSFKIPTTVEKPGKRE